MIRVSTIIPAYNSEASVAAAIDSALAQDFDGNEVIVTNDGSTDATAPILAGYGAKIRVVDQPNRGPSAARNAGARVAQGDFFAFLDADDTWLPGKLARMVPALEANSDAVLAFSDFVTVDESGRKEPSCVGRAPTMDDMLQRGWAILPSAVVMRRSIFERCCGFCEEFKRPGGDDPYMWLLAREHGEFEYVPEPLVVYDQPVISELADKYAAGREVADRLIRQRYGRRARGLIKYSNAYFAALLVAKAARQMNEGESWAALRTFVKSAWSQPTYVLRPAVIARLLTRRNIARALGPFLAAPSAPKRHT
ncbi:MAG: glycosyltransferase family 2 protein [Candidatus Binataceae bacterium]